MDDWIWWRYIQTQRCLFMLIVSIRSYCRECVIFWENKTIIDTCSINTTIIELFVFKTWVIIHVNTQVVNWILMRTVNINVWEKEWINRYWWFHQQEWNRKKDMSVAYIEVDCWAWVGVWFVHSLSSFPYLQSSSISIDYGDSSPVVINVNEKQKKLVSNIFIECE